MKPIPATQFLFITVYSACIGAETNSLVIISYLESDSLCFGWQTPEYIS